MQTDMATTVAERCIDDYYDKIEQENKRKYEEIQKRKELRRHKYKTAANIAVLLVMIGLCMSMVFLEMRVRSQALHVAGLQSELNHIVSENTDTKKRMMDAADYAWIEQEARKLGMTYPTQDMVIYYNAPTEDYMIQTQEIPEE